jgi:CubicO group peptidase (beta-lactamase class C family)
MQLVEAAHKTSPIISRLFVFGRLARRLSDRNVTAMAIWMIPFLGLHQQTVADTVPQRSGPSSEALQARVDAYFAPYVANREFSGVILVARGDEILVRKAYGMASYELSAPNTAETKFRIASITKSFTAAAIVMLKERGLLSFDDRLNKFLPDYPNGDKITVLRLLAHAAGIPNPDYSTIFYKRLTLDELIDSFKHKPLTSGGYSSAGYVLLARIVEKASGQTYEDFLRRNIFEPLGMSNTGNFGQDAIVPGRACGYVAGPAPAGIENALAQSTSSLIGSGSLSSTVDDLLRWAKAVRSERLYKRSALKYPWGWGERNQFGHHYIEQSGLIPGFISKLIIYFDEPVCVICLGNIQSGLFNSLEKDLTAIAFGHEPEKRAANPTKPVTVASRLLQGCTGHYQGPFFAFRVILEDDRLYLRFDDSLDRSYLLPTGDDELFMRSGFVRIRTTRGEKAQVKELTMTWPGSEPIKCTRLDRP